MKMTNEITLLSTKLLQKKDMLKEINYWLNVLNRPNGWHYDLDQVWILSQLESLGIKPGSTIVDAGAGHGLFQYILAAKGYNIISLDFSKRTPQPRANKLFDITGDGDVSIKYNHSYMNIINYNTHSYFFKKIKLQNFKKVPKYTKRLILFLAQRFLNIKNRNKFGKITFLRAPFHKMTLKSGSVDAIVSISSLEHADIKLFDENITEFMRVLKPGAACLITTSATSKTVNDYHDQTEGWCFSRNFLSKKFRLKIENMNFDMAESEIKNSNIFKSRLDPYYHSEKTSLFFKKKMGKLPYFPVAIKLLKPVSNDE